MNRVRPYIGGLMNFRIVAIAAACFVGAWTAPALADPCEGALPPKGAKFAGIVRYVVDGDGLCVGPANRPDRWIEIRLSDFYAPELNEPGGRDAKRRLERIAKGRRLMCHAGRRTYDRVVATCTLGGQPIGALLRHDGGIEGGRGWRK